MKQRLCLAKTLVHDPPVLILDEPASGLDPRARLEMKALLKELQAMGKTILISSHILSELADFCSSIGVIERGVLLAAGSIVEIQRQLQTHRQLRIRVIDQADRAHLIVRNHPKMHRADLIDHTITGEFSGDNQEISRLLHELVTAGIEVQSFTEVEPTLEEVFMMITKGLVT
jgi:ABC-2 type transport system ATP-binding protein